MAFCADDAKAACLKRFFFQRRNFRFMLCCAGRVLRRQDFQFMSNRIEIAAKLNIVPRQPYWWQW